MCSTGRARINLELLTSLEHSFFKEEVSGMVELYRIYLPKPIVAASEPNVSQKHHGKVLPKAKNATKKVGGPKAASAFSSIPAGAARQSSRATKLPSCLEEDNPKAMKARMMDKYAKVLKLIRDNDIRSGSFFLEPVDPASHGNSDLSSDHYKSHGPGHHTGQDGCE